MGRWVFAIRMTGVSMRMRTSWPDRRRAEPAVSKSVFCSWTRRRNFAPAAVSLARMAATSRMRSLISISWSVLRLGRGGIEESISDCAQRAVTWRRWVWLTKSRRVFPAEASYALMKICFRQRIHSRIQQNNTAPAGIDQRGIGGTCAESIPGAPGPHRATR